MAPTFRNAFQYHLPGVPAMNPTDRREFLKQTATGAAAVGGAALSATARAAGANERLTVALIGPGGMGTGHLNQLGKNNAVDLAWVCDVDQERLDKAASLATELSGRTPKKTKDLREVLDD